MDLSRLNTLKGTKTAFFNQVKYTTSTLSFLYGSSPWGHNTGTILQSMAELDEISGVQSHFLPHFLLSILINLVRALAILCKLAQEQFFPFSKFFPYRRIYC